MMNFMMMKKMAFNQQIFKQGDPDFEWKKIWIIPTDDENDHGDDYDDYDDNDDDSDDDDQNDNNSANFQARSSKFCMVMDLDIT